MPCGRLPPVTTVETAGTVFPARLSSLAFCAYENKSAAEQHPPKMRAEVRAQTDRQAGRPTNRPTNTHRQKIDKDRQKQSSLTLHAVCLLVFFGHNPLSSTAAGPSSSGLCLKLRDEKERDAVTNTTPKKERIHAGRTSPMSVMPWFFMGFGCASLAAACTSGSTLDTA